MRVAEENLNVTLASLLVEKGLKALGEVLQKKKPDIVLIINGVKIIIAGKKPGNRAQLIKQAEARVEESLCEICVMVEYACLGNSERLIEEVRTQDDVRNSLLNGEYNVGCVTYLDRIGQAMLFEDIESRDSYEFQENIDFHDLTTYLMSVYQEIVEEDRLNKIVERLNNEVIAFANNIERDNINIDRLKEALELRD